MRAKLVVVGGDTKTSEVNLRLPAILGRGREATLTLPHPLVSRQHCEITESDGQLIVRDLGSLNGTFVANERINETVLQNGQLLTVGTVTFRAVYLDSDADAPAPESEPADVTPPQVPDAVQSEETVPAPDAPDAPTKSETSPSPESADNRQQDAAPPEAPLAEPVTADDDDDLSQFFESLK